MALYGMMQKSLLFAELCFSVVAILYFGRRLPAQPNKEEPTGPVECNTDTRTGLCFSSNPEALAAALDMNSRQGTDCHLCLEPS